MTHIDMWHQKWRDAHDGEQMILRADLTSGDIYRWNGGVFVNVGPAGMSMRDWRRTIAQETGFPISSERTARDLHGQVWAAIQPMDEDPRDLNSKSPLLNMRNGVYDLRRGVLLPHEKVWATTNQVPHDFIDNEELVLAETEKFHAWMTSATDEETADVLWVVLGYIMAGGNPDQRVFILQGPGGSGKGTLIRAMQTLLGKANYSPLSLAAVGGRFTTEQLYRQVANIAGDVAGGVIPNYERLLGLTGGDVVFADRKGTDGFSFTWRGSLLLATNDTLTLPKGVSGQTGWHRRATYIGVHHPPVDEDDQLTDAVFLPSIMPNPAATATRAATALHKAMQGTGKIIRPSRAMQEAAATARLTGDLVADWANDRLRRARGGHLEGSIAFHDFKVWCANYGNDYAPGARRFYADLDTVLAREGIGGRDSTRTAASRVRFNGVQIAPDEGLSLVS